MLSFNQTIHAKRGKGVKDEFFQAQTIGKQAKNDRGVVENRTLDYSHVTKEMEDSILGELTKLENFHVLIAKALDDYKVEVAKNASNPVGFWTAKILEDGIITKDENLARQKAQSMVHLVKGEPDLSIEDIYEMMLLKAKK